MVTNSSDRFAELREDPVLTGEGIGKELLMQQPLKLEFRDIPTLLKAVIEPIVIERAQRLDKYYPGIVSGRVVVEKRQGRRRKGDLYRTAITLTVPKKQIVVNREHPCHHSHEDALVTVGHAFDDAARQLEEYARITHKDLKDHDLPAHGMISKIFPEAGYGFIQGFGTEEIYFHRNSVIDGFDNLETGMDVRFEMEDGNKGPQASTVKIVHREHLHHRH
jgi:cold shock CspA family protein